MRYVDHTGERFGRLVALEPTGEVRHGSTVWRCRCDCGNEVEALARRLKNGNTRSCGCLRKKQIPAEESLVGKRFGRLVAKRETRRNTYIAYECECDCGETVTVRPADLLSGKRTQCFPWDHAILGKRFGKLVVKSYAGSKKGDGALMLCACDCGKECSVSAAKLKKGNTSSCGCGEYESRVSNVLAHSERIHVEGTNLATIATDKIRPDNTTGVKGVCLKKNGKYVARITFKNKTHCLGTFETLAEAAEARREAEQELFDPVLEAHGYAPTSEYAYEDALRRAVEREREAQSAIAE